MKKMIIAVFCALLFGWPLAAHEGEMHDEKMEMNKSAENFSVKGEIIDMVCYLDHGAVGAKHAECAKTCISSGLPVGLKGEDGKIYLLVGEHKPINPALSSLAAKTVTVKGKRVSRDGFNMIENAEITQ